MTEVNVMFTPIGVPANTMMRLIEGVQHGDRCTTYAEAEAVGVALLLEGAWASFTIEKRYHPPALTGETT